MVLWAAMVTITDVCVGIVIGGSGGDSGGVVVTESAPLVILRFSMRSRLAAEGCVWIADVVAGITDVDCIHVKVCSQ